MPSTRNKNGGSQTFAEATTTGIDLTYARGCDFSRPFVILTEWRVRVPPAPDSDPVRRHGPERGLTGGGGRSRSSPSGPPLIVEIMPRVARHDDFDDLRSYRRSGWGRRWRSHRRRLFRAQA